MAFSLPWARTQRPLTQLCPALAGAPVVALAETSSVLPGVRTLRDVPPGQPVRAWLLSAAEWRAGKSAGLSAPTHAIVVFWCDPAESLTDDEREQLWQQFGVPVFEQWWTPEGDIVATECEAHESLHVLRPRALRRAGRQDWTVVKEPCACAVPVPRLAAVGSPAADLRATIVLGAAAGFR